MLTHPARRLQLCDAADPKVRDSSGDASTAFALLSRVTPVCPAVQRWLATEYTLVPAGAAGARPGELGGAPRAAPPARAVLDSLALLALLGGAVVWHFRARRPARAQVQRPWHRSAPAV